MQRPKEYFAEIVMPVAELLAEKGKAYGSSFFDSNRILSVLYPTGVRPDQYRDMLAITRIIDKLFRIATNKDALGENPWQDICGYSILALAAYKEDKENKQQLAMKLQSK